MSYINEELLEVKAERWTNTKRELNYTYWCERHPDLKIRVAYYQLQNRNRYLYNRNKNSVNGGGKWERFRGRVFGMDKIMLKNLPIKITPVTDMYNFYIVLQDFEDTIRRICIYNPVYDSATKMSFGFRVYMWLRLYEFFQYYKKPHNIL